jgi:hypothetical protein
VTYTQDKRANQVGRPKHQVKELEALLREGERKGWRVEKGKKYFKMLCPNACKCRKTVHLTPSGAQYEENLRHKLSRDTCWNEEADR